jgi:hypothetical protein
MKIYFATLQTLRRMTNSLLCVLFGIAFLAGCTQATQNNIIEVSNTYKTDTILFTYNETSCRVTTGIHHFFSRPVSGSSIFESGFRIELPEVLCDGSEADSLNMIIISDYSEKIGTVLKSASTDTNYFYMLSYEAIQTDSIVTLVITEQHAWYLSEGLTYKNVYHFDYKNARKLNTSEMLMAWQLSQLPILNAIEQQITQPGNESEPDYHAQWLPMINRDINQLKLYKNRNSQIAIIYPWHENPSVDNERIIE